MRKYNEIQKLEIIAKLRESIANLLTNETIQYNHCEVTKEKKGYSVVIFKKYKHQINDSNSVVSILLEKR